MSDKSDHDSNLGFSRRKFLMFAVAGAAATSSSSMLGLELIRGADDKRFRFAEPTEQDSDLPGALRPYPKRPAQDHLDVLTIEQIKASEPQAERLIIVHCSMKSLVERDTMRGSKIAFCVLQDHSGTIEMIAFPRAWEQYAEELRSALNVKATLRLACRLKFEDQKPMVMLENICSEK